MGRSASHFECEAERRIMEVVKKTGDFTIVKKRSGRYGVKSAKGEWINADKKIEILLAEGLIKAAKPKPKKEEPREESADEPAEETAQ